MIPGKQTSRSRHVSSLALIAEGERIGRVPTYRAVAGPGGRLVMVLPVGADMELTADYPGTVS